MKSSYSLDTSIHPGDDLFHHVNNTWLAANPIPEHESKWGTFMELREKSFTDMRQLVDNLISKPKLTAAEQKIVDFYNSGIQKDTHQTQSLASINELLNKIDTLTDMSKLGEILGYLHRRDVNALWSLYVDLDDKDAQVQVLRIVQGGLVLPDRDYYIEQSPSMQNVRRKYAEFSQKLTDYLSQDIKLDAADAFATESHIAEISWTSAECRNTIRSYNPFDIDTLHQQLPDFNWSSYFKNLGIPDIQKVVVNQTDVIAGVITHCYAMGIESIRDYLKWYVCITYSSKVNTELGDIFFEFFGKIIAGTSTQQLLWKKILIQADSVIGDELGKLYVKAYFPESSRNDILTMVERIRSVYEKRIKDLPWMEENSKQKAIKKLHNMKVLIGHPSQWRSYDALEIKQDNYVGNLIASAVHESDYHLSKVGKKPPREEWHMTPQTVNAYHDPNRLEIVFPAAILQYPFYSPDAHPAANLAGIGYVIGHELTHGFDDQGSLFDEKGELQPWLSDTEKERFMEAAAVIKKSADDFEVVPGVHMIGDLIIGEAIADLGGAELAWEALQDGLQDGSIPRTDDTGLPAEKIFFYSLATVERQHDRPEYATEMAKTDPHPDSRFRVNGVVTHMDAYYSVFDVRQGHALYRSKKSRARIW